MPAYYGTGMYSFSRKALRMKRQRPVLLTTMLLSLVPVFAEFPDRQGVRETREPSARPDGRKAYEHIKTLADASMKGRMAGTPEYRKAAEYVAGKFKESGLQPGGDN